VPPGALHRHWYIGLPTCAGPVYFGKLASTSFMPSSQSFSWSLVHVEYGDNRNIGIIGGISTAWAPRAS